MSEDPLAITKEGKALQQGLKDLLKNRDPWQKEVEFQRKNLQKQYLLLLLSHPNAKESKDAETHMWMQTSYALISIYKSRIATLEHSLREAGMQRQQPRSQRPGPVEYRKLVQRFKQFLSTEEKFWTHLVVRIQRQFALTEARSALATLSIIPDTEPDVDDPDAGKHDHFRFPPEPIEDVSSQSLTPAQRNNRRATLSKALVVLGDLARYREQYNEGGSRNRGGPERGGRASRGRGSQADLSRAKTYDKARACYECARDLMPDEGNASHQLAILASYQKDTFESLVQYYKALCVRSAYDPAAENMGNVLSKFLEAWRRRRKGKPGARALSEDTTGPKANLVSFKDNVILLHALWRLDVEMDSIAPKHDENVVKEFSELVSNRALPIDTIIKVVMTAQGALWRQRKVSTSASVSMESRITSHVLALHRALLQCGITELDEATKIVEEDLAMRITATFRRTLPALRISSKWLRVNLEYVLGGTPGGTKNQAPSLVIRDLFAFWEAYTSFATRIVLVFPPTSLPMLKGPVEEDLDSRGYLPLGGMLIRDTISSGSEAEDSRTPEQVHPNEEQLMRIWDIGRDARLIAEMPGTPMESFRAQFSLIDSVRGDEQVAAQEVTNTGGTGAALNTRSLSAADDRHSEEEDARTETTDPVGDVFREVLGVSSSEDEQDEIVWNPRSVSPPTVTPVLSNRSAPHGRAGGLSPLSPLSPTRPSVSLVPTSPPRVPEAFATPLQPPNSNVAGQTSSTPKTTAQDLLNNVMGIGRSAHKVDAKSAFPPHFTHQQTFPSPIRHHQRLSSSSQSQILFSGGAGPSIWSAAPDESALGLSPRHKANGALPASPLTGLAPVGHAGLQSAVPGTSSTSHANVHSGTTPHLFTPPTSSVQGPWLPYDPAKETLPTHVTHVTPTFPSSVERVHRHIPSSSIGPNDVFSDPGYQSSVVYASSPRQAPLPSNAPGPYSAQETLSTAFNNSLALSSTLVPPLYQSMATFGSEEYPVSHGVHTSIGLPKYGGVRQQRAGGVWGDAG